MAEIQGDGVLDEFEGNMRQALMGSAQAARSALQLRMDAAQSATRRDLEEARRLQGQLDAQAAAARAELAPVFESSWWDQTQVRDVARAYETAVTFRDEDQAARDAESRIRQELRDRYDVEVLETGADPAVVRATLVDQDAQRREREDLQAQARDDQELAAGLIVGAEVLEASAVVIDAEEAASLRELGADVELSWDSAERRELHVQGIQDGPESEVAAAAWKQADVDQARHPREALQTGRKGKTSRPRVPASTPARQLGRDGR